MQRTKKGVLAPPQRWVRCCTLVPWLVLPCVQLAPQLLGIRRILGIAADGFASPRLEAQRWNADVAMVVAAPFLLALSPRRHRHVPAQMFCASALLCSSAPGSCYGALALDTLETIQTCFFSKPWRCSLLRCGTLSQLPLRRCRGGCGEALVLLCNLLLGSFCAAPRFPWRRCVRMTHARSRSCGLSAWCKSHHFGVPSTLACARVLDELVHLRGDDVRRCAPASPVACASGAPRPMRPRSCTHTVGAL